MKTRLPLFFLSLLIGSLSASARIVAQFDNVDEFTDFSVSGMSEADTQSQLEYALDRFAQRHLKNTLPEGYTLEITFTDIDMAGDIQPWRNRDYEDIRYVESIYPPRLDFRYVLRDQRGKEILSGEERLRDLSFDLALPPIGFNDSFAYELQMLKDWARKKIAPLKLK
jgi:hypothetical protein